MKNIAFTIVLWATMSPLAFTQSKNIYLDAIQLSELKKEFCCSGFPTNSKPRLTALLAKYGLNLDALKNPFLSEHEFAVRNSTISGNVNQSQIDNSGIFSPKNFNPSAIPSISANPALDLQTSALQGIANFMANRFKQEAMQVGVQKVFKKLLEDNKEGNYINALFPKTVKYVDDLFKRSNSSYYSSDILMMKNFALQDIQDLPINMLEKPELVFPSLDSLPDQLALLKTARIVLQNSQKQLKPAKLIEILNKSDLGNQKNLKSTLEVLNLLSNASLSTTEMENPYVEIDMLIEKSKSEADKEHLRFFYALLFQELKNHASLGPYFNSISAQPEKIKADINTLLQFTNDLNLTLRNLKRIDYNLNTVDDKMRYVRGILNTLKSLTTSINTIEGLGKLNIPTEYFVVAESYFALTEVILKKKYEDAYPLLMVGFNQYLEKYRTLALLFELSNLKSASDFEIALNSYALPVGSSSIKRGSKTNLSVNGYVGLSGGHEIAYGTTNNITKSTITLSAPIGLSLTYLKGRVTTFVSLIDLGSVVNKSLGDDSSTESKLRVEHFFSPGLGFFYNFPNLPISTGFNYNYVPHLRNISYLENGNPVSEVNRNISRISFSFLVDIPFFTLHHRER